LRELKCHGVLTDAPAFLTGSIGLGNVGSLMRYR
jgi:hypothetical protein